VREEHETLVEFDLIRSREGGTGGLVRAGAHGQPTGGGISLEHECTGVDLVRSVA
jgi:hypothetical protein